MRSLLLVCFAWLLFHSITQAEEPAVPPPIELVLQGRAIETPILKYRLFPIESELHDGNAAPILLRLTWDNTRWMTEVAPKLSEWETRPLDAPEWKEFETLRVFPDQFYQEIKRAAHRREAHWEYPIHETQSPYQILLPDVQELRVFLKHGLAAHIRYHLTRGELDQAREGILVGLANARHLAETPFYVNQLSAIAYDDSMLNQAALLISQPDSPNLYWALSTLPEMLTDVEHAARLEGHLFEMTFPAARDLDRPRPAEEWKKMARQLVESLVEMGELEVPKVGGDLALELAIRSTVKKKARPAVTELLGIPAEKVAAMSDEEAGIRWYTHLRMSLDQHAAAIYSLPPREAWPEFRRLQVEAQSFSDATGNKHWTYITPRSVYLASGGVKRQIASLRILEAVRHYMATHAEKFPTTLNEIEGLSIPLDPLTDLPFEWQTEGQTATLKAPALPADFTEGTTGPARALEYRLRVRVR